MPADMRRATSSLSSSSTDRLRQPRSDDVEFTVRSHPSSISSNKSPVKFQIQMKRNPILQFKSDRTEGTRRHSTADVRKPVTPNVVTDSADYRPVARTEALKNLTLYASEDSDIEQVNEVIAHGKPSDDSKPRDGSKSSGGDISITSANKVNNYKYQRAETDLQRKLEDSSRSSQHPHHREHSDVRDKEQQSGHRDREHLERKRSSRSKERRISKERETGRYKDVQDDKKTHREYAKSADDRQSDRKRRDDEKIEAVRSYRHSDRNAKKSHESSSRSVMKILQTQCDTSSSHPSSSDRHRESSQRESTRSLKEPRKPETDLLPAESNYKDPLTKTRKSPPRADRDASYRITSNNISRSTNKVMADKEVYAVKPKTKETETHKTVDTDRKPVKKDADDRKCYSVKSVEKLESHQKERLRDEKNVKSVEKLYSASDQLTVDRQEGRLRDETAAKVNNDGRVNDNRHKVVPSTGRMKASSSSALPTDKKSSAASRKHRKASTTSSSSSGSSGSDSSSSDSDTGGSSSSSSDNSDEEDTVSTEQKSSQLQTRLHEVPAIPCVHPGQEKPNVHDISEGKSKLDCDTKVDKIVTDDVSRLDSGHRHVESVSTKETIAALDEITNRESSTDCKPVPAAVHPEVPDIKVTFLEAPTQKCSTDLYSPSFPTDMDVGWEEEACADAARWSSSDDSDVDDAPPPPPPPPQPCPPSNAVQPSSSANNTNSISNDRNRQSSEAPKPVTAGSKQDMIVTSSVDASGNRGSTSRSASDTGGHADTRRNQKDRTENALPKVDDGCRMSVNDDRKLNISRHDDHSASDGKNDTKLDTRQWDRSRSRHANGRSRFSRSRSRSRERRHRMTKDDGRSRDTVDKQRSTVLDRTASRRSDIQCSQSPAAHHADRPSTSPARSSFLRHSSSRQYVQNTDMRQKSSSYSSSRSTTVRQSSGAAGNTTFKSAEPVVVIDTDDEDEDIVESIPLPVSVPNFQLDDIPLPVPVSESSNLSLIHI